MVGVILVPLNIRSDVNTIVSFLRKNGFNSYVSHFEKLKIDGRALQKLIESIANLEAIIGTNNGTKRLFALFNALFDRSITETTKVFEWNDKQLNKLRKYVTKYGTKHWPKIGKRMHKKWHSINESMCVHKWKEINPTIYPNYNAAIVVDAHSNQNCTDGKRDKEMRILQKRQNVKGSKMARFKCEMCDKDYASMNGLNRHRHHHFDSFPFYCDNCGKGCVSQSDLSAHMRIHTGERPFKCTRCDMAFAQRSSLKSHFLVHSGVKPHKCDVCGKQFRLSQYLARHKRKYCLVKPYKCTRKHCNKSFQKKSGLSQHIARSH